MTEPVQESKIPVENIYYLLSYAWGYLPERDEVQMLAEDCHTVEELLARVLVNGTQHLVRRGLDRSYVLQREETSRLKGQLDLTASFSRQTMQQGRLVCEFDELSHDVLHNQILKTTLRKILKLTRLSREMKAQVHQQLQVMPEVQEIRISARLFRRTPLHRNNKHYRLLMNVCELIHHSLLPTEQSGELRFRDFLRDKRQMPALFEKFILNFYKRHSDYKVSSPYLYWDLGETGADQLLVPRMETDICLYKPERQIILDCKFYEHAFTNRFETKKLLPAHLYQLFAYLENVPRNARWEHTEGVLLYPTVSHDFTHEISLNGHQLRLVSVNLDQPWSAIERALIRLVN